MMTSIYDSCMELSIPFQKTPILSKPCITQKYDTLAQLAEQFAFHPFPFDSGQSMVIWVVGNRRKRRLTDTGSSPVGIPII